MPGELWSIRTSPRGITKETPFLLVYRTIAMIPTEIIVPTIRSTPIKDQYTSNREIYLAKEKINEALKRMVKKKRKVIYYKNKAERFKSFVIVN